jgi:dihydroorotase
LKWAIEDRVALPVALSRVTAQPAAILGAGAGHLGVGAPADVCIFDPDVHWRVEPATLKSQGKNTPFLDLEVRGRVRATLVGGRVVHEG